MFARFDHVVVGIRSLSEGIAHFQRLTGATAVPGGVHPGRGTENAVVALGPGEYLEIIAPQAEARLSEADAKLRGLDRLTIVAWAVAVDNADEAMQALKQSNFQTTLPQHGSRVTPSGQRLEWEVFKLSDAKIAGAPFFIEWSATTAHPSTTAPAGCARERFRVQTPASVRLSAAMQALGVRDVAVSNGAHAIEAAITCGPRRAILMSR
jgi:Glyoxalase-like domain